MGKKPKVLDLFCGIGGLSLGLCRAGLESIGGVDNWEDAARTYEHNLRPHRCLLADIAALSLDELIGFFRIDPGDIDVVAGGPPCQGFSTIGKRDSRDPRNRLWEHYLELVSQIRPSYVMIENVEGLVVMDRGGVCARIMEGLGAIGYHAKWRILRSADYGVPQLRKRVIFLAWLEGVVEPAFPSFTVHHHVTVADAIFDLPALNPSETATGYTSPPLTLYQKARRRQVRILRNHEAANHSAHLVEVIKHIPDGGNRKSIPEHLQPKSGFHNSYARLASDKPAVAVTSNMRKPSSARTTHPKQNRGLTVREGLRLQTFDDSFVVLGTRTSQYLQVGNAVPPLLGEAIGKELVRAFHATGAERAVEARAAAVPAAVKLNRKPQLLIDYPG